MTTRDFKTEIAEGGLRYRSKTPGTQFSAPAGRTMSCFICGKHVPRSAMESFRVAGSTRFRCVACAPSKDRGTPPKE